MVDFCSLSHKYNDTYILLFLSMIKIHFYTLDPSVMDATSVLNAPNAINELHSITVTCTIHPDSTADQCVVTAMADGRVARTGTCTDIP